VLLAMALAGGAAVLWLRAQPQLYRARAVVQLVDRRQELAGGLAGDPAESRGGDMSVLSQLEIVRSRAVAAQVVDSVPAGLRVRAVGFSPSLLADVAVGSDSARALVPLTFTLEGVVVDGTGPTVPYGAAAQSGGLRFVITERPADVTVGSLAVLTRDDAIDQALGRLDVSPRRQTSLLDVVFTTDDPLTARRVVNAWVQTYQVVDAQRARAQTRRRLAFVEEQLALIDRQRGDAEGALSRFRTRLRAYSPQEKIRAQRSELAQLDGQRQGIDAERRLASTLLQDIEEGDPEGRRRALNMLASSAVGATPVVSRLYTQLVSYEGERGELTSGPSGKAATNPDVLRLDTLAATTRRQLTDAVRAHIALLDARIASLDERRRDGDASLGGVASVEAEETRLQQNVEVLREQAGLLRAESQRVRIADAAAVGQVEIVDPALRATPLETPGSRVLAFALLAGLVAGGGLAVLREAFDRSIRSREAVEGELGLPLLATIPRIEPLARARGGRFLPGAARRAGGDVEQRRSVALTAASELRAPSSEAFRQLRTNLSFVAGPRPPRTIVVTSAIEGEGKTSVAVNLAISFTQQRLRVLLIDCDLLASGVHRVFGLPSSPGLQQVVLEDAAPRDAVRPTSVPGLYVMTAGAAVADGGEALGSPRMRELLRLLAPGFDVIILDSPPVLAVSDSLVLGVAADAVVLVARAGCTRLVDVMEALRHLEAAGAQVAGGVLNDPDGRVPRYGGEYYAYGYNKSYGRRGLANV
jgi:capsular exopolysaccharide synthesis family protein